MNFVLKRSLCSFYEIFELLLPNNSYLSAKWFSWLWKNLRCLNIMYLLSLELLRNKQSHVLKVWKVLGKFIENAHSCLNGFFFKFSFDWRKTFLGDYIHWHVCHLSVFTFLFKYVPWHTTGPCSVFLRYVCPWGDSPKQFMCTLGQKVKSPAWRGKSRLSR